MLHTLSKILMVPGALAAFEDIPSDTPPLVAVDNYLRAKLRGDKAQMAACEYHVRMLPQLTSGDAFLAATEAVQKLERYVSMRKPGRGGSQMLQDVADKIEQQYQAGEFERRPGNLIRFTIWTRDASVLRVTCENRPGAVELLAAKYRRGIGNSRAARYGRANA